MEKYSNNLYGKIFEFGCSSSVIQNKSILKSMAREDLQKFNKRRKYDLTEGKLALLFYHLEILVRVAELLLIKENCYLTCLDSRCCIWCWCGGPLCDGI